MRTTNKMVAELAAKFNLSANLITAALHGSGFRRGFTFPSTGDFASYRFDVVTGPGAATDKSAVKYVTEVSEGVKPKGVQPTAFISCADSGYRPFVGEALALLWEDEGERYQCPCIVQGLSKGKARVGGMYQDEPWEIVAPKEDLLVPIMFETVAGLVSVSMYQAYFSEFNEEQIRAAAERLKALKLTFTHVVTYLISEDEEVADTLFYKRLAAYLDIDLPPVDCSGWIFTGNLPTRIKPTLEETLVEKSQARVRSKIEGLDPASFEARKIVYAAYVQSMLAADLPALHSAVCRLAKMSIGDRATDVKAMRKETILLLTTEARLNNLIKSGAYTEEA